MSGNIYVPILKWKRGEQFALLNLKDSDKAKMTPMFSVVSETEPKPFIDKILRFWGNKYPIYVGFHQNVFDDTSIKTEDLMLSTLKLSIANKIKVIPAVCSNNTREYFEMIKSNLKLLTNGMVIHIKPTDYKTYDTLIDEIINNTGISKRDTDLIIDLYRINASFDMDLYYNIVSGIINNLSGEGYRRIIFSASSFPDSLAGTKQNSISEIPRIEWNIWRRLKKEVNIDFGDYASDDPLDISLSDGATIIPTVRYTKENQWYIIRGSYNPSSPRDYQQFHKLCKMLVSRRDIYCGKTHCWGDEKIHECAANTCVGVGCNHGNLETWVKIGINHHLTFTMNQVSTYPSV